MHTEFGNNFRLSRLSRRLNNNIFSLTMKFSPDEASGFFSINSVRPQDDKSDIQPDLEQLPLLPTRNLVLFPDVAIPITLGRASSLATAERAERDSAYIGVVCQLDSSDDNPSIKGLFKYGVFAQVLKVLTLPDDTKTALVQARGKFKILGEAVGSKSDGGAELKAHVKPISEVVPKLADPEFVALATSVKDTAKNIMKAADSPSDVMFNITNVDNPAMLINVMASTLPFDPDVKMKLLAMRYMRERGVALLDELTRNSEMINLTREFQKRAKESLDDKQRSAFLQQQMEAIRTELYGDDDEPEELRKRAADVAFPENVEKVFNKELDKLRRVNPQSPDYSVQYTYLETLLDLPWGKSTPLVEDISAAADVLNSDHFGLDKVKERILEQMAVMINNPSGKAPIICLVGPPGVGKTSLGQSIARALGRNYQRVSLGGVNDESEIRGHRRTYIGAMPGRIIDALKRAGSSNPVLLLDEIDKLGRDFKGDPGAALLEVLDPEQNCKFHDNYVDVDYDLSNVLFIATANSLSTLSQPLLDRMEIVDIAGYLLEEKVEIAKRHFIPRLTDELNASWLELQFPNETIEAIIDRYTAESGVRQLEKRLSQIMRKRLLAAMNGKAKDPVIRPDDLQEMLGAPIYNRDKYEGNDFAGVVTGLAWTAVGGEILFIESSLSASKGEKLTLTGNLGDVMKESAVIALQYVKSHAAKFGINSELFDKYTLHIHVPEGAIPKDGPSAGITMATSIVSTFTQRKVKARVAMTGEITLRGKVLPVGGIKEKILAAKRAGITDIVLSADNRKDILDISENYLSGLSFHYVNTVTEVIDFALTDELAADHIDL